MLLGAFALWNGSGNLRLSELLQSFDAQSAQAIYSLVIAVLLGADHVDSWLVINGRALEFTDHRLR